MSERDLNKIKTLLVSISANLCSVVDSIDGILNINSSENITDFGPAVRAAVVEDAITDGVIDMAPSENAVYDALSGKSDTGHTHIMVDITDLPVIEQGTYTPTITNQVNVAANTPHDLLYTRVGDVVSVSGWVEIDPTAAAGTETQILISLPISTTNFAINGGTAFTPANGSSTVMGASITIADVGGAVAIFDFLNLDTANRVWMLNFSYLVE